LGAEVLENQVFETDLLEAELLEAERALAEADDVASIDVESSANDADTRGAFVDLQSADLESADFESRGLEDEDAFADLESSNQAEQSEIPAFSDAEAVAFAHEELPAFADIHEIPARLDPIEDLPAALPLSAEDPDLPLEMDELDAELVDIFVEEAQDLLDHSDQLLVKLRDAPEERDIIVGLQRDLHTLKGGARMAGIMPVGELGHTMESMLEAVAEQRTQIDSTDIPLLERGFDRLHAMVTRIGARRAVGMPSRLIGEFEERVFGKSGAALPAADAPAIVDIPTTQDAVALGPAIRDFAPQESAPRESAIRDVEPLAPHVENVREASAAPSQSAVELSGLSAPIDFAAALGDDEVGLRGSQEQVRVRAELLDRLVNYAGEVAIYRSRLEQQLGAFRGATAEMGQTNIRLRDQLRRLEIETEAQIIARYQREGENRDQTFDPLELDRFSTLQQLSRALAETATDLTSLQSTLDELTQQYETLLLQQSRVSSELQEGLMRTRMLPFAPRAASGRQRYRQVRAAQSRRRAGRARPQRARTHDRAARTYAAQRRRARSGNAETTVESRQAGRRHGPNLDPQGRFGSRVANQRRRRRSRS
jgi:chemosensory pili system protein ChpA (sensor histidine kinase/response regulator)